MNFCGRLGSAPLMGDASDIILHLCLFLGRRNAREVGLRCVRFTPRASTRRARIMSGSLVQCDFRLAPLALACFS